MKILLLPGLDGTGELFGQFCKLLPSTLTSSVCSLPTDGEQDPNSLAQKLAGTYLLNEDVVLIAESFSGPVAHELVWHYGDKIKGVVFVSSWFASHSVKLGG